MTRCQALCSEHFAPPATHRGVAMPEETVQRSVVLSVLPYGVMSVVAVIHLTAGSSVGFLPLVSLGPAFAGLVGGWRRTALVGVIAMLLCLALGLYDGLFAGRPRLDGTGLRGRCDGGRAGGNGDEAAT